MKKIIINKDPWQTRVALMRDDRLQNIYFSSRSVQTFERAFYRGIITKVLPGIQTAFVDIGQEKAGFLHISEIDRELAFEKFGAMDDESPRPARRERQSPDISKIFKEGDPVLVQVSKEPVYEKGAKLTTCFTLPGRFVVLMPNIPRIGVSKKIEDREDRNRLKEIVAACLPEGMGAIIRTTSQNHSPAEIQQDIAYLVDTWHSIQKKFNSSDVVERLHEDLELSLQIVRDHLDEDVESIITDDKENQSSLYKFIKVIAPEYSHRIQLYTGSNNIFEFYHIEKQIDQALDKKVLLKSGGSLIIESTEAMTVVDVNTGKFIGSSSLEETIYKTNIEAAQEVVRQLRLRNIGGLIVIDFIDMATGSNRQKLFKFFEKSLKEEDKFQSVVLKVSEFGLVQMTRKRSGKTLQQQLTNDCPRCHGSGWVRSLRTLSCVLLRKLKYELMAHKPHRDITVSLHPEMFKYITTVEYEAVFQFEKNIGRKITWAVAHDLVLDAFIISS